MAVQTYLDISRAKVYLNEKELDVIVVPGEKLANPNKKKDKKKKIVSQETFLKCCVKTCICIRGTHKIQFVLHQLIVTVI